MKTSKFKTNAKCNVCVAKIGEELGKVLTGEQWKLDLSDPDRVLEVVSEIPDEELMELVRAAGFKVEKIEK